VTTGGSLDSTLKEKNRRHKIAAEEPLMAAAEAANTQQPCIKPTMFYNLHYRVAMEWLLPRILVEHATTTL
jgi:hypothetical protein